MEIKPEDIENLRASDEDKNFLINLLKFIRDFKKNEVETQVSDSENRIQNT